MKVLVIGSGGREHTLCWRLGESGHEVVCTPGNGGIAREFPCISVDLGDQQAVIETCAARGIELVVVGPEAPLVAGLADALRGAGLAVFGPGARGAQLEGSKIFAKEFFARHGIPTGDYRACETMDEAHVAIAAVGGGDGRVVVKADGLAAGKGVVVCASVAEAVEAAASMLEGGRFGAASQRVLIEERLSGRELSVMAITDGRRFHILATAEDHKAVFDGDRGPNTGGMGAVSPAEWVPAGLLDELRDLVFVPTVDGLRADGIEFCGVLYAGLMLTEDGPKMLEYNVRFGDPETQAVLPRLRGDFGALLAAAARGELGSEPLEWSGEHTAAVVMASEGYPERAVTGRAITGLDQVPDALVFHAGTRATEGGGLETSGGRVLAVVGRGDSTEAARRQAYAGVEVIHFEGAHFRRDIGARQPV